MADEDDDTPKLSAHALAALQEFLSEQRDSTTKLDDAEAEEHEGRGSAPRSSIRKENEVTIVSEDWRLSQFWYDPQTSYTVAQELDLLCRAKDSPVACISCPSLYVELKKSFHCKAHLFEYDPRFQRYQFDFTFYDYNSPEDVPQEYKHAFKVVVADPPYLSEECIRKTACTMKLLAKDEDSCLLLLTGAIQGAHARSLLAARPCGFQPSHQNKLGNEFRMFTNYDPLGRLGGWQQP